MEATQLRKNTVNGVEVTYSVTSYGKFIAEWGDNNFDTGDTLEKVEAIVKRKTAEKPVRVNYPFSYVEGEQILHGTAVGIHARTYEPLLRDASGNTLDSRHSSAYFRRLNAEERQEGERLMKEVKVATEAYRLWREGKAVNLRREVSSLVKAEKEKQETRLKAV